MGAIQVIMRTERRRKWDAGQRDAITVACDEPGVTIRQVAERYDVSESMIYSWRAERRKRLIAAALPQSFVSYGEIADIGLTTSTYRTPITATKAVPVQSSSKRTMPTQIAPVPVPTQVATDPSPEAEHIRAHPGERPGAIELHLASGTHIIVDSYVNERALLRALSALMDVEAREQLISERRRKVISNKNARADGRLETDGETRARTRRVMPESHFLPTPTARQ